MKNSAKKFGLWLGKTVGLCTVWTLGISAFFFGGMHLVPIVFEDVDIEVVGWLVGGVTLVLVWIAIRHMWFWSISKPLMMFKIRKIPCPSCRSIDKEYLSNRIDVRSSSRRTVNQDYNAVDHHGTRWIKVCCVACGHSWEEGVTYRGYSLVPR